MSAQTLRDNAAKFRKDKSLLSLIEVRDGNDVEPKVMQMKAIAPVRDEENFKENEDNVEKIMENINKEENEDTRIMGSRFEEILRTLTKENIYKGKYGRESG